jgi:hypothetical protein
MKSSIEKIDNKLFYNDNDNIYDKYNGVDNNRL